jgi:DNA-binding beta-propeller fold protein YncE
VSRLAVGRQPTLIRAGYGAVWVLNASDGTLTHIDPATRKVVATLTPDTAVNAVAVGSGGIWFSGHRRASTKPALESTALERVDPRRGVVDRTFTAHTSASAVAAGGGAIWSTGLLAGRIRGAARSDAASGAMRVVDIGIYGDLLAADDHAAYYVASLGNRIARVDARSGRMTSSLLLASAASLAAGHVPATPTDVALGGSALWVSENDGTVLRVDRGLHRIVAAIRVCGNALALAYGEDAVWVACGERTVVRVDPSTDRPSQSPIRVDGLPRGIAAGEGAVWVTLN